MDKVKEIRVKFFEEDMWLYDWISNKSCPNSSFLKDLAKKDFAKEQVEIYGSCSLVPPPVTSFNQIQQINNELKETNEEIDFDIDDLED